MAAEVSAKFWEMVCIHSRIEAKEAEIDFMCGHFKNLIDGWSHTIRIGRRYWDALDLCFREAWPMAHSCVCYLLRAWLNLWISSRCVAFWRGRGNMGCGGCDQMEQAKIKLINW